MDLHEDPDLSSPRTLLDPKAIHQYNATAPATGSLLLDCGCARQVVSVSTFEPGPGLTVSTDYGFRATWWEAHSHLDCWEDVSSVYDHDPP